MSINWGRPLFALDFGKRFSRQRQPRCIFAERTESIYTYTLTDAI